MLCSVGRDAEPVAITYLQTAVLLRQIVGVWLLNHQRAAPPLNLHDTPGGASLLLLCILYVR